MEKNQLKKILKLRKITKFSIILCKESLKKNDWNIKNAIKYLRDKEYKKNVLKNKLKYGLVYSRVNKNKTLGYIIKLSVQSEDVSKNPILLKLLKKILSITIKKKLKNINEVLNNAFNKKKSINNELIDKSIMFKDSIKITKFNLIKNDYVFNYNHYNNKIASIISYLLKKNSKIIKKILKYISLDIVGNFTNNDKSIIYLNNYYRNNIDPLLLKRIKLDKKKYLYYFKYITISSYYIISI